MTTALDSGYRSAINTTVADLDEKRHQVLVSIPAEEVDHHGTSWGAYCFRDSFARRLPDMLLEHRRSDYIGRALRAESLRSEARIIGQFEPFESNDTARRTFDDILSGKLKGWSWHFERGVAEPNPTRSGTFRYRSAHMDEFSAVARPSLVGARTAGIRSQPFDIDSQKLLAREAVSRLVVRQLDRRGARRDGEFAFQRHLRAEEFGREVALDAQWQEQQERAAAALRRMRMGA